ALADLCGPSAFDRPEDDSKEEESDSEPEKIFDRDSGHRSILGNSSHRENGQHDEKTARLRLGDWRLFPRAAIWSLERLALAATAGTCCVSRLKEALDPLPGTAAPHAAATAGKFNGDLIVLRHVETARAAGGFATFDLLNA